MEFDLQWLLWGLPLAFALGWLASKLDVRQMRRESRTAPKAYFKGLSLLLNDQQDKAIDAFIEAVQNDPDTTELHFALGNLFRRRGEFERAVRVHQHLLGRADLGVTERDRAQHALAQDFMKAGLMDRAEGAYKALEGSAFDTEARLALLNLYERSRDWPAAVAIAQKLEQSGSGSFASRIAHYRCEQALVAQAAGDHAGAAELLATARTAAPFSARAFQMTGEMLARQGQHAEAMSAYAHLLAVWPEGFDLAAQSYALCALACHARVDALAVLQAQYERSPSLALLNAVALLDPEPSLQAQRRLTHLRQLPSLSAALSVLQDERLHDAVREPVGGLLRAAVAKAAKPLQRYRCAACGFEAQTYFWQCPACLNWDSYPPRQIDEQ